jgi:hypothetical protein
MDPTMMEDEPFDAGKAAPPIVKSSKSGAPPPIAAFQHGNTAVATTAASPASPAAETVQPSVSTNVASAPAAASSSSKSYEHLLKKYDTRTSMENHRTESTLSASSSSSIKQSSSMGNGSSGSDGQGTRRSYDFASTNSYDTSELIRKYGSLAGPAPAARASTSSIPAHSEVRSQALKVLDMVDDHLKIPLDVRRTESGGFRAFPADADEPYAVSRSPSGGVSSGVGTRGNRRVPSALAGLALSNNTSRNNGMSKSGRYSFTDPSFKDDDDISEEDEILHDVDTSNTSSFADVEGLQNRGAASRTFDGDYPSQSSWSSRYNTPRAAKTASMLDQWDREHAREFQSARNMFASSAHQVKQVVSDTSGKVFGSGFSFRQQNSGKSNVNLRTVWKDVDDQVYSPPPVHKTWQEAMLNKRKRRRICFALLLCLSAAIIVIATVITIDNNNQEPLYTTKNGLGEPVTFYVTSDVPYSKEEEAKFTTDLSLIPGDAEFLVHLGNIQDSVNMCPASRYGDVASIFKKSPVPMMVIPGAEDWVNCPKPVISFDAWMDAFGKLEDNFSGYKMMRYQARPENFAVMHGGVLFVGLHLVEDLKDTDAQSDMLKFYYGMLNLNKDNFRAIVIFGNTRPTPAQNEIFKGIKSSLNSLRIPVAYVHANSGEGSVREYTPFEDSPNILGIEVEDGGKNPPLRITVGFGDRPFLVG